MRQLTTAAAVVASLLLHSATAAAPNILFIMSELGWQPGLARRFSLVLIRTVPHSRRDTYY